ASNVESYGGEARHTFSKRAGRTGGIILAIARQRRVCMRGHRINYLILGLVLAVGLVLAFAQKKPADKERPIPPGHVASPELNKQVVRRVFDELFNQGRYDAINQIYASNCKVHFGSRNEALGQSVEEGKGWRSAAPDLVMTVGRITANGDMVEVDWVARGTHTGAGHGLKPTGKKFMVRGSSRFQVENGKIVEVWNSEYRDDLLRQLGVSRPVAFVYEKLQDLQASLEPLLSKLASGL